MFPLSLQDSFLVPEFQGDVSSVATSATNVTTTASAAGGTSTAPAGGGKVSTASTRQAQFRDEEGFVMPDKPVVAGGGTK